MELRERDQIEVMSNKVAEPHRRGVVLQVLEADPLRVEVEWSDGHTSVFLPAGGNVRVVSRAT